MDRSSGEGSLTILPPLPPPGASSILAFHGGGFMGYFSALVADALQERHVSLNRKGHLSTSFDAICGTSIGAVLAAAVATKTPTGEVVRLMESQGENVFPRRRFLSTWPGIFGARFRQEPLRELLEDILGDIRLVSSTRC